MVKGTVFVQGIEHQAFDPVLLAASPGPEAGQREGTHHGMVEATGSHLCISFGPRPVLGAVPARGRVPPPSTAGWFRSPRPRSQSRPPIPARIAAAPTTYDRRPGATVTGIQPKRQESSGGHGASAERLQAPAEYHPPLPLEPAPVLAAKRFPRTL